MKKKLLLLLTIIFSISTISMATTAKYQINDTSTSFESGTFSNTYISNEGNGEISLSKKGNNNPLWIEETNSAINLPQSLEGHQSIAYNNRLYVLGGKESTQLLTNKIYYWDITGQSLSNKQTNPYTLPVNIKNFGVIAYNNWIYVIGGELQSGEATNEIYAAQINANGSINEFVNIRTEWANDPLPTNLKNLNTFLYNGYIYVIGGDSITDGVSDKIYYAQINIDGKLGSWQTQQINGYERTNAQVAINSKYLYVFGGNNGGSTLSSGFSIKLDGSFTITDLNNLPLPREKGSATIYGGLLYIIGGESSSTKYNNIYISSIKNDGELSSWLTASNFSENISNHKCIGFNNGLFISGGTNDSGESNKIFYSNINPTQEGISSFFNDQNLPQTLYGHSSIATSNMVLVLGGYTGTNYSDKVYIATQNASTGELNSWIESANNLPSEMSDFATILYDSKLYIFGGQTSLGRKTESYYTTINNTTKTIGTWTKISEDLPNGLTDHTAINISNKVYLIGGKNDSPYTSQVLLGTITANDITSWTTQTPLTPVKSHQSVIVDEYILAMGGEMSGSPSKKVQYNTIDGSGNLDSTWKFQNNDMPNAIRNFASSIYEKDAFTKYIFTFGGYSSSETDAVTYIQKGADFVEWKTNPVPLPEARSNATAVTLGNFVYIIGGSQNGIAKNTVYKANLDNSTKYSYEGAYSSKIFDLETEVTVNNITWIDSPSNATLISYDYASENGIWQGFSSYDNSQTININKKIRYIRYHVIETGDSTTSPLLQQIKINFTAPEINISVNDYNVSNVTQNSTIKLAKINLNSDSLPGKWDDLSVSLTGYTEISKIKILDSLNNVISSTNVSSAQETISLGGIEINSATQNFYIAVDVKPTAQESSIFHLSFDESDFIFRYPAEANYAENSYQSNLSAAITKYTPVVNINYFTNPAQIEEAATEKFIEKIQFNTDLNEAQFSGISFNVYEYNELSAPVTSGNVVDKIYIYRDRGTADGGQTNEWDGSGKEELLGSVNVSSGENYISFSEQTITQATSPAFFIVIDIDPDNAEKDHNFKLSWEKTNNFNLNANGTMIPASINYTSIPKNTLTYTLIDFPAEVTFENYSDLFALQQNITQNSLCPMMKFQASTDKNDAVLGQIKINLIKNVTTIIDDIDIDNIYIYADSNDNETFDEAQDTIIGYSKPLLSGENLYANINTDYTINSTPKYFFAAIKINSIADPLHHVKAEIPINGIIINTPGSMNDNSFLPIETEKKNIEATTGDSLNYNNHLINNTQTIRQSNIDKLFDFNVKTNQNGVAVNGFRVQLDGLAGKAPIDLISKLILSYYDSSETLITISSSNITNTGTSIEVNLLTDKFKVDTEAVTFNIRAEIKANAETKAQFQAATNIPGNFTLRDDGTDSSSSFMEITSNIITIEKYNSQIKITNQSNSLTHVEKNNEYLFQDLSIQTISHTATMDAISITPTPLPNANDIALIKLYKDDGNNTFNILEEIFLNSAEYNSINKKYTISFPQETITTKNTHYYLCTVISSNATDYNQTGIIVSANSFRIDNESEILNPESVYYNSSLPIIDPNPSTLNIIMETITTENILQGQKNIIFSKISIKMNTGESHLQAIKINATGDSRVTENIESIKLYLDNGDESFSSETDTLLSNDTTFLNDGTITFNLINELQIHTTTINLFTIVDVQQYSNYDIKQGISIISSESIKLKDSRDKINSSFPLTLNEDITINVAIIEANTLFTDISPTSLMLNSADNLIGKIEMKASQKHTYWETVKINLNSSATAIDVASIALVWDKNKTNSYDGETYDTLLVSTPLNQIENGVTLDFTSSPIQIGSTATENFLLYANISNQATPNNKLRLNLENFVITNPDYITPAIVRQTKEINIESMTVNITIDDISPLAINHGENTRYFGINMYTDKSFTMLEGITINRLGDAPVGSVESIKIYKDSGDHFFTPETDDLIASENGFIANKRYLTFPEAIRIGESSGNIDFWVSIQITTNYTTAVSRKYIWLNINNSDIKFNRDAKFIEEIHQTNTNHGKITDPPSNLVVSNPLALTTYPTQGLSQGTTDTALIDFTLNVEPDWETILNSLKVDIIKTDGGQDSDIALIKFYLENNANGSYDSGDLLLSTSNIIDSAAQFSFGDEFTITNSTKQVYIVADIKKTATIGAMFKCIIYDTNFDISAEDNLPTNNVPISSNTFVIEASSDLLNVSITDQNLLFVTQDAKLKNFIKIGLKPETNAITLTDFSLQITGNCNTNDIDTIYLYKDTNSNGIWNQEDMLIATQSVNTFNLNFISNETIYDNSTLNYFILLDINEKATINNKIQIDLNNSMFNLEGIIDMVNPFTFSSSQVPISIAVDLVIPTITDLTENENFGYYKATNKVGIIEIDMQTNMHDANWKGITINIAGNANDSGFHEIEKAYIYFDVTQNGTQGELDQYDTLVGSVTINTGMKIAKVSFNQTEIITTSAKKYFMAIDISIDALVGRLTYFNINQNDFDISTPDMLQLNPTPQQTKMLMIEAMQTNLVVKEATSLTEQEIGTGTSLNVLEKIVIQSNHELNIANWSSLKLHLNGTASDSDIENIHIYKDDSSTGLIGQFDIDDTEITTGNNEFLGKELNLVFTQVENISITPNIYYLLADISPSANIDNTFWISITDSSDYGGDPIQIKNALFQTGITTIQLPRSLIYGQFVSLTPTASIKQANTNRTCSILQLWTNGANATLESIKFDKNGNIPQDKINNINIFRDNNNDGLLDPQDTKISNTDYQFTDNSVRINFGSNIQTLNTTRNYLIVCDISNDAEKNSTIGFEIKQDSYFSGFATDDEFNSTLPISSPLTTIYASQDQLMISLNVIENNTVTPDEKDIAIFSFSAKASSNYVELKSINIETSGNLPLSYFNLIKIYKDNGIGNEGSLLVTSNLSITDTLVGQVSGTSLTNNMILIDFSDEHNKIETSTTNFFIAVDVAEIDDSLKTIDFTINATSSFVIQEPSDNVNATTPFSTQTFTLANTIDKLYVIQQNQSADHLFIAQESENYLVESFSVYTNKRFVNFNYLQIRKEGTLNDEYINNIQIYKDNGDKIFNLEDETKISSQENNQFISNFANISLQVQKIGSTSSNYYIVLDIDKEASPDDTIEIVLSEDVVMKSFTIIPPDKADNFTWNPHTYLITRYNSLIDVTINTPITTNVGILNEFTLYDLEFMTWHSSATIEKIDINLNGYIQPEHISSAKIYKESGDLTGKDVNDTLINDSYVIIGNKIVLNCNFEATTTTMKYYIVLKIDENHSSIASDLSFINNFRPTNDIKVNTEATIMPSTTNITISTITYDERKPIDPEINYQKFSNKTDQMNFNVHVEAQGGVDYVEYCLGTTPGAEDIRTWTKQYDSVVSSTPLNSLGSTVTVNINVNDINLIHNNKYYIGVRAMSVDGILSDTITSNEITIDTTKPQSPGTPEPYKTSNQIDVPWNYTTDYDSSIRSFQLQLKTGDSPTWKDFTLITAADEESVPANSYLFTPSSNFETYYFRVKALNNAGSWSDYSTESSGISFGSTPSELISDVYNYPNPFYPDKHSTKIRFTLNKSASITVKIYDLFGNFVKELNQSFIGVGIHTIEWDGSTSFGSKAAKGGYLAVVEATASDISESEKVIIKIGVIR